MRERRLGPKDALFGRALNRQTVKRPMTNTYRISSWGQSDIGLRRPNNEDAYQVNDWNAVYVVADGMGGEAAGEVASRIFIETADELKGGNALRLKKEALAYIEQVFGLANARILDHVKENPRCTGMGCTAELLIMHAEGFLLGHVGDSRTYRLRNGQFQQLTKDHSLVQQQIDDGLILPSESQQHPLQNVILRAVGIEEDIAVDIIRGNLKVGDQLLLCSDGLSDMIADDLIADALCTYASTQNNVESLIEQAKISGGRDNFTVVLVDILP